MRRRQWSRSRSLCDAPRCISESPLAINSVDDVGRGLVTEERRHLGAIEVLLVPQGPQEGPEIVPIGAYLRRNVRPRACPQQGLLFQRTALEIRGEVFWPNGISATGQGLTPHIDRITATRGCGEAEISIG